MVRRKASDGDGCWRQFDQLPVTVSCIFRTCNTLLYIPQLVSINVRCMRLTIPLSVFQSFGRSVFRLFNIHVFYVQSKSRQTGTASQ